MWVGQILRNIGYILPNSLDCWYLNQRWVLRLLLPNVFAVWIIWSWILYVVHGLELVMELIEDFNAV